MKMKIYEGIFIFVSLFGYALCSAPLINAPEEWVFEVITNETGHPINHLDITCTGDKELQWITKVSPKYHTVESNRTESKFFSTLSIEEPLAEDTGYFNCSYKNDDGGKQDSTYVYVYDGLVGFAVNSQMHQTVTVEIGDPIVLDCRTTSPDIKVTVFKNNAEDVTAHFQADRFNRFSKIANSLQETGFYTCKENRFKSDITILVTINPRRTLQAPSIEKHGNSHYVVGDDFSLNCSIPVEKDDSLTIEWELPNPNTNKMTTRWNDGAFAISMLKVKSPTLSDSGNFTCVGREGDSSVSDYKTIQIKERIDPFVKFEVKNDTKKHVLFVKEGEDFHWVMYFKGYPRNLTYIFYNPSKRVLRKNKKVDMYYGYEDGQLSLNIKEVTAEEFGNYSVRMEAPNGSFDENYAILIVNATPKIDFGRIPPLYQAGRETVITAFILAFSLNKTQPLPIVSWWFHADCPKGIGSCDLENRTVLNYTLAKDKGPLNRYKSTVTLRPTSSGLIVCKVKNDLGVNSTQVYLKVSDKSASFLVMVMTEVGLTNLTRRSAGSSSRSITVVEGDRLRIECFTLDFLYETLRLDTNESFPCDSELSSGRCLNIWNVSLQDERPYECAARNILTEVEDKIPFRISVAEKMAPVLLPSSNVSEEGTSISVKSSDPFAIACYVEGRPTPEITWFKDGKNIEELSNFVDNKERVFLQEENQVLVFKFAQKDYEGMYECNVENRVGQIQPFASVIVAGAALSSVEKGIISLVVAFIVALVLIVLFLIFRVRKESKLRKDIRQTQLYLFEKGNVGDLNKECTIDEQAELLPYDRAYEVERERIKLGKQLGVGAFGRVMLAEVRELEIGGRPTTRVAVKMCKDGADMAHLRALTLELKIMIHLGKHLNIVNLIGANTVNMDKGDLWILVEYCKYGNLLKFIQRAKSQFINQIDSITGEIDLQRTTPLMNDPISPTSLGRGSVGFGRNSNVDQDGYLEARLQGGSFRSGQSTGRHPSTTSRSDSTSGVSRPGLYVGNPHYTTVSFLEEPNSPTTPPPTTGADHYVMATQLPTFSSSARKESSASIPSSELGYHLTVNTEMTTVSSPPPFSPTSSTSGDIFFDSQGKPVTFDSGSVPGVSAPFTTTDLICWAWQVANGMDYLTRRKVLHGDLAARNLLLAENNVVKISDFGLSRDMYKNDVYMKKGDEIMPIKWMAPEAIQQKVFSIQSDVWAYGITLWEMFTLGNTPYPGIPLNQEFTIALENGMRMERPKYCNEELYTLMLNCWRGNPIERPSFTRIADTLSELLSPESRKNYVEMNTFYARKNEEWMGRNEDYLNMVSSPDFQNLHAPLREEERVGLDESYIAMRVVTDSPVGEEPQRTGYLDMRSVRSPTDPDSIFSPRPPSPDKDVTGTLFSFSEDEAPLSEDHHSPVETSSLLDKSDISTNKPPNISQTVLKNHNNNTVENLSSLDQQQQQPLYQNLEKVALTNKHGMMESVVTDNEDNDTKINYANIMAV